MCNMETMNNGTKIRQKFFLNGDASVFYISNDNGDDKADMEAGAGGSNCEGSLTATDTFQKAESTHDSSSGFASDGPSYNYPPSSMSTFKGKSSSESETPPRKSCLKKTKAPPWSESNTPSYKLPHHYHPQDLNMPYRMSTPSPMSHLSRGSSPSIGYPSSSSQKSSYISSSSQKPSLPVINYKNPAYEYQLDRHIEKIQYNIKRMELHDTEKLISSKGTKYRQPRLSVFDLLTDEVVIRIFSSLSSDQLCRCSRVCTRWYNLVWDPILWKEIVINSETINVDKAVKYLTKRLSYNTPTVCVIVEKINFNGCEKLSNRGLHTIAKRCPELRKLELQGCSNISNPALSEVVSYCVNLEHLDITGCPCITSISLTDQMIRQALTHHLGKIYLRFLDMTDCYALEDQGLQQIAMFCSQLQYLYLRRCVRIGDAGLQAIANYCHCLKEFSISDCKKVTDFGICELAKLEGNLRYLSVAKCEKISDVGIIQLAKHCTKLRYLNVRGCEAVSDDSLDVLARYCSKLKSLDVGKCDITDEGLEVLAQNCSQLRKLSLKSCDAITDDGVKAIAIRCRHLQQLNIQDCHLTVDAYRTVKRYCKQCFIEHTNPGFY